MAASACAWMDGALVAASVNKDDAVTDVDAVVSVDTEAEAVAPARSDNTFPISNYRLQTAPILETGGRFVDPPSICSPTLPQGTSEGYTCDKITCEVRQQLRR